jgi:hypothetical protein
MGDNYRMKEAVRRTEEWLANPEVMELATRGVEAASINDRKLILPMIVIQIFKDRGLVPQKRGGYNLGDVI